MQTHESAGFGPFGQIALRYGGKALPLQVLRSGAGYYLGTCDIEDGPVSRESTEYFATEKVARSAGLSGLPFPYFLGRTVVCILARSGRRWRQLDQPR